MILPDFLIIDQFGIYCKYGDFYLDPQQPVKTAVISHAHGDHAVPGNGAVYCTEATSLFMIHRYKKNAARTFNIFNFEERFTINGVDVTFFAAGHMLGSAMILLEFRGVRYLYTGDYKLQHDQTCERAVLVEADVLITETTFANPETLHPPAELEILNLNTTTHNIMLGAYALGKTQRIVRLINDYCIEKRILLHHSIVPYMSIYRQLGVQLGKFEAYDRKVMKHESNLIYIVPPLVFRSYIKAVNVKKVFASGWKHLQKTNDLQLLISDHVDWNDILATVEAVKPKEVWTNHGNGLRLKEHYDKSLVVKLLN